VKVEAEVVWAVTHCSDIVGNERFGGSYCHHLQGELKMEATLSPETLTSYHNTALHHYSENLDMNINNIFI